MAFGQNVGGSVNNTNGFTSYANNFVYNTSRDGFPGGNPGADNVYRVGIADVTADYATGAGGINPRTDRGDAGTVTGGGGDFRLEIAYSSGTLQFGRNTGGGGQVVDNADGGTWGGKLVGALWWYTYATAPQAISATRSGRNVAIGIAGSASDGGSGISSYRVQRTDGLGNWVDDQDISSGSYTYTNLTPGRTYQFRTYANNGLGSSQFRYSATVFVPAGGRRYDGTSWVYAGIARRYTGSAWVDLTIARRYTGSAWVDLS